MGNYYGKEDNAEEVEEYLDANPGFLKNYIDRNPHLLSSYVIGNVDEVTAKKWYNKVKKPAPSEVLEVLRVDYLRKKNCLLHRTDKYLHKDLIVRRAGEFDLVIYFKNRAYLPAKDEVTLVFAIGKKPKASAGTLIRVPAKDFVQASKWTCMLTSSDNEAKSINVKINVPPDAIIGKYKLTVEVTTELKDGKETQRHAKPDVIVLFNPFNAADDCYIEGAAHQTEYVLNDKGKVYVGRSSRIGARNWLFGQFEEGILDIALKLLREDTRAKKDPEKSVRKRSSPVYCSRILSAMVNNSDDTGVLWGRWDGEYKDGVTPSFWSGSVKILKKWNESKMMPVQYGQCWVFSGVLTTVLRAIGIPARSVTNFNSAHDTEYNMTIDKFINEEGDEVDKEGVNDSIWNFHVWNEGYFRRPDLPKGYDGWQALDATPQEESGGIMQCGPAPLTAIKNGEIYIGNDTNFLFGEVNADVVYWKVDAGGNVTGMIRRNARHVGKNISTKAVGSDEREDVTNQYKFPEGTPEERRAFERAYAHSRKADYHDKFVIKEEGAITIDFKAVGDATNGQDFTTEVQVKNTTEKSKNVKITTVIHTMLHNDERKALLKRVVKVVELPAGKAETQSFVLPFSEYGHQLADDNVIRFTTTARVEQTGNLYVDTFDVELNSPECLTIECDDEMKLLQYHEISFTITNPLSIPLTGAVFGLIGKGIEGDTVKASGPIAPGETYKSPPIDARPYSTGTVELIADFDAKEIKNIRASKTVSVNVAGSSEEETSESILFGNLFGF